MLRKGQEIFNFLEWLRVNKKVTNYQSHRMADPFYILDKDWNKYWKEFKNG